MNNYNELLAENNELNKSIAALRRRKRLIKKQIRKLNNEVIGQNDFVNRPIWLYVLELEDGFYYVGLTRNVDKRFNLHSKGKGAKWTKIHKPVSILHRELTQTHIESEASKLEDALTLKIAKKYGYEVVRGGQWCYIDYPVPKPTAWIEVPLA